MANHDDSRKTNRSSTGGTRTKTSSTRRFDSGADRDVSSLSTKVLLIGLAISALVVGVYIQVTKNLSDKLNKYAPEEGSYQSDEATGCSAPSTLIIADNMDAGSLTPNKLSSLRHHDLIWTHDYPFQMIKQLEPRQRINHFPGTGFITNKITLSTTPKLPHILKAFRLPAESEKFLNHVKQEPGKLWIQKSSSHRGISIETAETVRLDLDETLVQEYMSNPLLIDGKKFDIGIYAVLTSVEPLRVYIYEAESLLRFCAQPYIDKNMNKFNSSNIDSYVVGDDYTPIWLMPSLLRYYIGTGLSMKQTLNSYLKARGKDGEKIWVQIEETIKKVYKLKEHHIARMSRMYQTSNNYNQTSVEGSLNQFFEMVRFDFIIDDELNVYLMEANMSPNLSSRHFPPNKLLYEQVLNSYFSLVGLTQYAHQNLRNLPVHHTDGRVTSAINSSPSSTDRHGLDSIISEKDLSVYEELCSSNGCHMNCFSTECRICYFCLNQEDKLHLRRAIFEQYSKWNFKRLLPSTNDNELEMQLVHPESNMKVIDSNYIHVQWFRVPESPTYILSSVSELFTTHLAKNKIKIIHLIDGDVYYMEEFYKLKP